MGDNINSTGHDVIKLCHGYGAHPVEGPLHRTNQAERGGSGLDVANAASRDAVTHVLAKTQKHLDVALFDILAVLVSQGGDFQQGRGVVSLAFLGGAPIVKVCPYHGLHSCQRVAVVCLNTVKPAHDVIQRGDIALINQFFFGFDIVVKASFGQPQPLGNIQQGG